MWMWANGIIGAEECMDVIMTADSSLDGADDMAVSSISLNRIEGYELPIQCNPELHQNHAGRFRVHNDLYHDSTLHCDCCLFHLL